MVSAPSSSAQLTDLAGELRRLAKQTGLDAVGVCDAAPFEEARVALNDGRLRGWDAGMQFTYRNPDRSTNPSRALPGARAMVVGALAYAREPRAPSNPQQSHDESRPKGLVARYAWEDHYRTLRAALNQVADRLRSEGWRATVLADDNALVDRAAAVRAGLGWYGKNTNVLIPGAGSWFVLGSVLTDAPLPADGPERGGLGGDSSFGSGNRPNTDESHAQKADGHPNEARRSSTRAPTGTTTRTPGPVEDGCGTCRRCIDACPTGALSHDEPGHLDASKCLAWLVQAPGIFPRQYRIALHDRMYGCDDCQEACPINRVAERRHTPPEVAKDALTKVDILNILEAPDRELLDTLGRWYIPDRDPKYLRRNALIVLGNTGDATSLRTKGAIERAVADADPIIRAHAVWAAARLGYYELIPSSDRDPQVQDEMDAATKIESRTVHA
jgi:epoxyqueuosine reductase